MVIRPLDVDGFRHTTAGPFYHSAFQYDNGNNSGYNPNSAGQGVVGGDVGVSRIVTSQYQKVGVYLDDNILSQAEAKLRDQWDQRITPDAAGYWLLFHNCHDYTNAVLAEYNRLSSVQSNSQSSNIGRNMK